MNEEPLVSIVTPSYNQAQYLEDTIQSVLTQDYPRIEYIVIDGGSTDGSLEIIKKYADRISYWVSEKDKGQTDALNKGFAASHGSILAWLNSDDTYRPGAIRAAVEYLSRHPQVGMVYGDLDFIDENGKVVGKFPPRKPTSSDCARDTSTSHSQRHFSALNIGKKWRLSTTLFTSPWITTYGYAWQG